MNINDVDSIGSLQPEGGRLVAMFERQVELFNKYRTIEAKKKIGLGLLPNTKDIDDYRLQYVLKDYAWRVTEEITESTSASDQTHKWEELSDATHFLIELLYLSNIDVCALNSYRKYTVTDINGFEIKSSMDMLSRAFVVEQYTHTTLTSHPNRMYAYNTIESLGLAMNCLKNKPWKRTQMATDKTKYRTHLCETFGRLIRYAIALNMHSDTFYQIYFRKATVNDFRITSEY